MNVLEFFFHLPQCILKHFVIFYVLHREKKRLGKTHLYNSKYLCLCLKGCIKYLAIIYLSV